MTLDSLILAANTQGWAVTLRQHPDRREYWEAALSRPIEQTVNGTVREIAFAIGHSPYTALDWAMNVAAPTVLVPTGLPGDDSLPAPDLLNLLGLAKSTPLPQITRR